MSAIVHLIITVIKSGPELILKILNLIGDTFSSIFKLLKRIPSAIIDLVENIFSFIASSVRHLFNNVNVEHVIRFGDSEFSIISRSGDDFWTGQEEIRQFLSTIKQDSERMVVLDFLPTLNRSYDNLTDKAWNATVADNIRGALIDHLGEEVQRIYMANLTPQDARNVIKGDGITAQERTILILGHATREGSIKIPGWDEPLTPEVWDELSGQRVIALTCYSHKILDRTGLDGGGTMTEIYPDDMIAMFRSLDRSNRPYTKEVAVTALKLGDENEPYFVAVGTAGLYEIPKTSISRVLWWHVFWGGFCPILLHLKRWVALLVDFRRVRASRDKPLMMENPFVHRKIMTASLAFITMAMITSYGIGLTGVAGWAALAFGLVAWSAGVYLMRRRLPNVRKGWSMVEYTQLDATMPEVVDYYAYRRMTLT